MQMVEMVEEKDWLKPKKVFGMSELGMDVILKMSLIENLEWPSRLIGTMKIIADSESSSMIIEELTEEEKDNYSAFEEVYINGYTLVRERMTGAKFLIPIEYFALTEEEVSPLFKQIIL